MRRARREPEPEEPEPVLTDVELVKLAMWFIDKCGDPTRAERAMRAALAAVAELAKR